MTMPFYVAPEQVMKDRADYARKGIARGRSAVAVLYTDGILIAAENSMGFHAPQEAARVLGEAIDYARQGQIAALGAGATPSTTTK